MQEFPNLLSDIWKESCRHIDVRESVARVAPMLAPRISVHMILMRALDLEDRALHTIATEILGVVPSPLRTRSECTAPQFQKLLEWCRSGQILRKDAVAAREEFPGLLPADVRGHIMAGPLTPADDSLGVLILVAAPSKIFREDQEEMVRALLDPFAAAFKNSQQIHELEKLREAAEADNRSLLSRLGREDISDSIVGSQTGLREVMERVDLVSRSAAPALIIGETGSGKEVVARALHKHSNRKDGPFLKINCGAIPPHLIDSELFGHERGSFTGATDLRKGWFERADGGTLLLDEVGELPLAAQVRLLRILQDGSFERVGGQRQLNVDVRVITATHRNLKTMVAEGRFREDLWYRVAVFPISIPPLRERREDIPALATHFALRAARRLGSPPLVPSPAQNDLLLTYSWPGNVRELAAVIERAAILGGGSKLEIAGALGVSEPLPARLQPPPPAFPSPGTRRSSFLTLDEAMKQHIESALELTKGRVEGHAGAARLLGVHPSTLRGRMRRLKVDWKRFE